MIDFGPVVTDEEMAEHRADALSRMTSRCTIHRDTGTTATSPTTGRQVKVWRDVHGDLPCRLGGNRGGGASRQGSSGGVDVELALRVLHLPHDVHDLTDGDLAEITSGEWAGTVWRLVDVEGADQQTARRVAVMQTRRPIEWG